MTEEKYLNFLLFVEKKLKEKENTTYAKGVEKYMKNLLPFYGLRGSEVKSLFQKEIWPELSKNFETIQEKISISLTLIQQKHYEPKNFVISILRKITKEIVKTHEKNPKEFLIEIFGELQEDKKILEENKKIFEKKKEEIFLNYLFKIFETFFSQWIFGWALTDTLSSFLSDILKLEPEIVSDILLNWSEDSTSEWKQRASCVSFVKVARFGKHDEKILKISENVLNSNSSSRWVQLGNGWMLRELSLSSLKKVENFLKKNYSKFSREGFFFCFVFLINF